MGEQVVVAQKTDCIKKGALQLGIYSQLLCLQCPVETHITT